MSQRLGISQCTTLGGDSWNLLRGMYVNHRIKEWYSRDSIVDVFIRVSRCEVSMSHT